MLKLCSFNFGNKGVTLPTSFFSFAPNMLSSWKLLNSKTGEVTRLWQIQEGEMIIEALFLPFLKHCLQSIAFWVLSNMICGKKWDIAPTLFKISHNFPCNCPRMYDWTNCPFSQVLSTDMFVDVFSSKWEIGKPDYVGVISRKPYRYELLTAWASTSLGKVLMCKSNLFIHYCVVASRCTGV